MTDHVSPDEGVEKRMIFEFINPSDPYHFEAPDLEVAAVVTFILGAGKGAAHEVDEEKDESELLKVPLFLFGGADEWVRETFKMELTEFLEGVKKNRKQDLIASLESVTIGSVNDYNLFNLALSLITDPEKKREYREKYHDLKRSSLNDFGTYAWAVAKTMKENIEGE